MTMFTKMQGTCAVEGCRNTAAENHSVCFMHIDTPHLQLQPEKKCRKCSTDSGVYGADNSVCD